MPRTVKHHKGTHTTVYGSESGTNISLFIIDGTIYLPPQTIKANGLKRHAHTSTKRRLPAFGEKGHIEINFRSFRMLSLHLLSRLCFKASKLYIGTHSLLDGIHHIQRPSKEVFLTHIPHETGVSTKRVAPLC